MGTQLIQHKYQPYGHMDPLLGGNISELHPDLIHEYTVPRVVLDWVACDNIDWGSLLAWGWIHARALPQLKV